VFIQLQDAVLVDREVLGVGVLALAVRDALVPVDPNPSCPLHRHLQPLERVELVGMQPVRLGDRDDPQVPFEQLAQELRGLRARQVRAQARVNAPAEAEVRVRGAVDPQGKRCSVIGGSINQYQRTA
jgi:hypothetical protein